MAKPDFRINEHGIDVRFLHVGDWVTVRFNDWPDQKALITRIEDRQDTYKGERTIRALMTHPSKVGWNEESFQNTQVVKVISHIRAPK